MWDVKSTYFFLNFIRVWFFFGFIFILYTKNEGKQEIIKYWKKLPSQALDKPTTKNNGNNNNNNNNNNKKSSSIESDIITTQQKIKMKDSYSYCDIKIPSRSKNCTHIQPFDLITYLQRSKYLQENKLNTYVPHCTECDKPIGEKNFKNGIIIDGYLFDIFNQVRKDYKNTTFY